MNTLDLSHNHSLPDFCEPVQAAPIERLLQCPFCDVIGDISSFVFETCLTDVSLVECSVCSKVSSIDEIHYPSDGSI